jgi:hypothetical protein
MAENASTTNNELQYILNFGLARSIVTLEPDQSQKLHEDMKNALFELLAAVWGVSRETYKSKIAVPQKAWMVDARDVVRKRDDLKKLRAYVSESSYAVFQFIHDHHLKDRCKRAEKVRTSLIEPKEALHSYIHRLWQAIRQCLTLNQLFDTSSARGTLPCMPEAFLYCIESFLTERQDDDVACCQFGEQFLLVMHILAKAYASALSLLAKLDAQEFSDTGKDAYSIEIPAFIWDYEGYSTPPSSSETPGSSGSSASPGSSIGRGREEITKELQTLRVFKQARLEYQSSGSCSEEKRTAVIDHLNAWFRNFRNENGDDPGDAGEPT